ncbi:GpE family phage tail protein [Marinimicrobium sp. ARAG 43.8]
MADIAAIFHWGPQQMHTMPLHELMDWREQARLRSGADDS